MSELILVGDRVLIEPRNREQLTQAGLVLPATVANKEKVHCGRVTQVGPGYLSPQSETGESWGGPPESVRWIPLQAESGDLAFYLHKDAVELTIEGTPQVIVPHHAILALLRGDLDIDLDKILDGSGSS